NDTPIHRHAEDVVGAPELVVQEAYESPNLDVVELVAGCEKDGILFCKAATAQAISLQIGDEISFAGRNSSIVAALCWMQVQSPTYIRLYCPPSTLWKGKSSSSY